MDRNLEQVARKWGIEFMGVDAINPKGEGK